MTSRNFVHIPQIVWRPRSRSSKAATATPSWVTRRKHKGLLGTNIWILYYVISAILWRNNNFEILVVVKGSAELKTPIYPCFCSQLFLVACNLTPEKSEDAVLNVEIVTNGEECRWCCLHRIWHWQLDCKRIVRIETCCELFELPIWRKNERIHIGSFASLH